MPLLESFHRYCYFSVVLILMIFSFLIHYSDCEKNIAILRRLDCVQKLLHILQDGKPHDPTLHTIASVLSVLLNKTNRDADLLRYINNTCNQYGLSTI